MGIQCIPSHQCRASGESSEGAAAVCWTAAGAAATCSAGACNRPIALSKTANWRSARLGTCSITASSRARLVGRRPITLVGRLERLDLEFNRLTRRAKALERQRTSVEVEMIAITDQLGLGRAEVAGHDAGTGDHRLGRLHRLLMTWTPRRYLTRCGGVSM